MRALRRLASRTHHSPPAVACTSGSTKGVLSITTRDSRARLTRTVSNSPAGPQAKTATPRVPSSAMPGCSSASRTASTSSRSAMRSSWERSPSSSSTLRWASLRREVIALARAGGVANSAGSRLRYTESTRPRSGARSASRRSRVRVTVSAMVRALPRGPDLGTLGLEHAEALEHDEERAGERGFPRAVAHAAPVHLLAQRARHAQQALVAQGVLGQRHQLRDEDVLERHHAHLHAEHGEQLAALDHLVGDLEALRVEDEVDQHVAVPGLDEPFLGRVLDPHALPAQRLARPLDVLALDDQVEVVARLGAAAGPARQAPADQEGDAGVAQRGGGALERALDVGEVLGRHAGLVPTRPERVPASAWPSSRRGRRPRSPRTAACGSPPPATSTAAATATASTGLRPSRASAAASTSSSWPATSRRTASPSRRRSSPTRPGTRRCPCSPSSATTTGTPTAATRWRRHSPTAASTCSTATTGSSTWPGPGPGPGPRSGSWAARASSAASPAPTCPTSASRCCARSTRRACARSRRS